MKGHHGALQGKSLPFYNIFTEDILKQIYTGVIDDIKEGCFEWDGPFPASLYQAFIQLVNICRGH